MEVAVVEEEAAVVAVAARHLLAELAVEADELAGGLVAERGLDRPRVFDVALEL